MRRAELIRAKVARRGFPAPSDERQARCCPGTTDPVRVNPPGSTTDQRHRTRRWPRCRPHTPPLPGGARREQAPPGRKRTRDSVEKQLNETLDRLTIASALDRVQLLQRRLDLEQEMEAMSVSGDTDLGELEDGFVAVAKSYSERKGLTYAAWREADVDARVLKQAGITRGPGA